MYGLLHSSLTSCLLSDICCVRRKVGLLHVIRAYLHGLLMVYCGGSTRLMVGCPSCWRSAAEVRRFHCCHMEAVPRASPGGTECYPARYYLKDAGFFAVPGTVQGPAQHCLVQYMHIKWRLALLVYCTVDHLKSWNVQSFQQPASAHNGDQDSTSRPWVSQV